eukprot:11453253-Alexandrium_andersonii.AAC.1
MLAVRPGMPPPIAGQPWASHSSEGVTRRPFEWLKRAVWVVHEGSNSPAMQRFVGTWLRSLMKAVLLPDSRRF